MQIISRTQYLHEYYLANKDKIKQQRSFESIKLELDKCILLCGNCHNYHHYKESNPDE